MELTLTTPALLFPAISLLLLAYTNRFLALSALVRDLVSRYKTQPDVRTRGQIANLRHRLLVIRNMQFFAVLSFFLCVLCMFLLFFGLAAAGQYVFGTSLVTLLVSLALSLREIWVSVGALQLQLAEVEDLER